MGYACPVCDVPQRDAEHLANHLAFTAILHGDDHEAWLDEHAPGWSETNAADLGPRVAEFAPETEYEEVFEDTVQRPTGSGRGDLTGPGHQHGHDHLAGFDAAGAPGSLDVETEEILREARELTRKRRDEADEADEGDGGDGDDRE